MAMTKQARSLLSLVALLGAAAGAGAFAYFGVFKAEIAENEKKDADAKAFVDLDKAAVKTLSLTAKGETVVMARDGDGWKITSPVQARADKYSVEPILDKLVELKSKQTVAEDASKAAEFGLTPPAFAVVATFTDKAGAQKSAELRVGIENPLDLSLYYARGGDPRVYLADSGLKGPLDKSLFDLRDKSLVTHEDKEVQGFTAEAGGASWTVERAGEGWKLTAPLQDGADKGAVDAVLSRLRNARAKAFAAETAPTDAAGLKAFGLDKPVAVATFALGADKAKKTLQFGEVDRDGTKKSYARLLEGGPVLEVEDGLAKELAKPAADLRDKTVAAFDRDLVRRLEIAPLDGPKLTVTRSREKAAGSSMETDKFTVDGQTDKLKAWKLSSALYTLSSLKGTAVVDEHARDLAKYGLDKPSATFTAYGEGDVKLAEIRIGAQSGAKYYAASAGSTRVFEVEKGTVDELPRKKDDVVEVTPPAPPAGPAPAPAPAANGG